MNFGILQGYFTQNPGGLQEFSAEIRAFPCFFSPRLL
jgi:hypothetical protein